MNKSELIFCYDISNNNPNGDPIDSNKPRIDEEAGINLVTDVRLKRTIRDYLFNNMGHNPKNNKEIFVRETILDESKGYIKDGKNRSIDFLNKEKNEYKDAFEMSKDVKSNALKKCIDIRLFGGVIPIEKDSKDKIGLTFTGPVQFRMGQSMHKVEIKHIKGTGAFASDAKSKQSTFREEYVLPYSFINFYGIINGNTGKETGLTNTDVNEMVKAMWNGTKELITRSKVGQMPRLLIKVNYNNPNFFIGDLNKRIKLVSDKEGVAIRDVEEFKLDITSLKISVEKYSNKIENIEYLADDRVSFIANGEEVKLSDLLNGKSKEISL